MHDTPAAATPVELLTRPLARFLRMEAASGVVLLFCTAVALSLANSPYAKEYAHFWHTRAGLSFGAFHWTEPLEFWINDGLMMIFFFVIGLEIKRELVFGELREPRKAALPILGAIGGMLAPASIYLALQWGQPGEAGWGVPMATDIAFVVGFLALLGARVPFGLKIFLLSLAIADDIGAILVIAIFYSSEVSLAALGIALIGFAIVVVLNNLGARGGMVYVVVGGAIWLAMLQSGVHPTVAGVLLGLLTPARAWNGVESVSPLQRMEHALHPWVAFAIMPIFALANAGVAIEMTGLRNPIAFAVALGLLIGKPLGIVAVSWLGVRTGLARLPSGVDWKSMWAGGCLAGIGFTMSLFIANLAFDPPGLLDAAKLGTLLGSVCSAIIGCVAALLVLPPKTPQAPG